MIKRLNLTTRPNASSPAAVTPGLTQRQISFWHWLVLFAECLLIGWLMNGLNASLLIYVGTLLVCAYLIRAGLDGMALASVWVVGWMSWAAVNQLWLRDLPRPVFQIIPLMLFIEWLFMLAAVWHLALAGERAKAAPVFASAGLFGLVAGGIYIGWRLYPYSLVFVAGYFL